MQLRPATYVFHRLFHHAPPRAQAETPETAAPRRHHHPMLASAVALAVMAGPSYSAPPPPATAQTVVVPLDHATAAPPVASAAATAPTAVAPDDSLAGRLIVIDPGHGGPDQGASSSAPPLLEKDLNLDIALRVRDELVDRGAQVVMTRAEDREVAPGPDHKAELQARSDISNRVRPDLFVSIHNNASTNPGAEGTEVYMSRTASPESRALARAIYAQLDDDLPTEGNGVRTAGYYVLRHTTAPSVLTEVAYVSNARDAHRLGDPAFRQDAADAIADGIGDYLLGTVVAQAPTNPHG